MVNAVHSPLLPNPTCLHLSHLEASSGITTVVSTTPSESCSPVCQCHSDKKVHSRYVRNAADILYMG